jgi:hypothetical protein
MLKQQPSDDRQHDSKNVVEQNHIHGKNPVVFGAGRDVSGNHIGHVGDIYAPQFQQVEYLTEKIQKTPIHIPSIQRGAFWALVGAITAFVANFVTIVTNLGTLGGMPDLSWSMYILLAIFMICLSIYVSFRSLQKGNSERVFRSWVMAQDENQRLTFKKLYAQCPCGGTIHLSLAPKGTIEPCIGRCDRNPQQHKFTFDKTTRFGVFW